MSGIAVASGSGDTFLADAGAGAVYRYGPLVTAVQPEVPSSEQAPAGELKAESVKLQGVLSAGSEGESGFYEFVYRQSATECEGAGGKVTPRGEAAGKRGEVVSSVVGELVPNTVYTFCLRVSNGAGETAVGAPVSFTTRVAVPVPGELSVSDVAATSATLNASVNPGGGVTSYVFELAAAGGAFGLVGEAGGAGTVAEGTQGVAVSVHTQSLRPGTVYELRVSASNSAGTVVSEPLSFTTQVVGGFVLPDGRQWELVSPADKHGAVIEPLGEEFPVQAAPVGMRWRSRRRCRLKATRRVFPTSSRFCRCGGRMVGPRVIFHRRPKSRWSSRLGSRKGMWRSPKTFRWRYCSSRVGWIR
jgi:hypothetical protein